MFSLSQTDRTARRTDSARVARPDLARDLRLIGTLLTRLRLQAGCAATPQIAGIPPGTCAQILDLSERVDTLLARLAPEPAHNPCDGDRLSPRELEILLWIARGKSNVVIADILGISRHTVDTHNRRIFRKLGTADRTSAALRAVEMGLL